MSYSILHTGNERLINNRIKKMLMTGASIIEHGSRENSARAARRAREEENKRERRITACDLLSNQLSGRAAGLAASTSVTLSASGPRASSLIPTPVRLPVSPLGLSTPTFSRTLASRTARTPYVFTHRHAPETGLPRAKIRSHHRRQLARRNVP